MRHTGSRLNGPARIKLVARSHVIGTSNICFVILVESCALSCFAQLPVSWSCDNIFMVLSVGVGSGLTTRSPMNNSWISFKSPELLAMDRQFPSDLITGDWLMLSSCVDSKIMYVVVVKN